MEQRSQAESALAGAAYGMLFMLGVVLGVVGGFTQSWYLGDSIPAAAVGWVIGLLVICLLVGRMMRGKLAALMVAAGWLLVSMLFSVKLSAGDLVISGDLAGYIYLYGGMAAVVIGVLLSPSSGKSWLLRGHYGPPLK